MLLRRGLTGSLKTSLSNSPSAEVSNPSTILVQTTALTTLQEALQLKKLLRSCKLLTSLPSTLSRGHLSQVAIQIPVMKHQLSNRTAAMLAAVVLRKPVPVPVAFTVPRAKLYPLRACNLPVLVLQLTQVDSLSRQLQQLSQVVRSCQMTSCSLYVGDNTIVKRQSQRSCLCLALALQAGMTPLSRCAQCIDALLAFLATFASACMDVYPVNASRSRFPHSEQVHSTKGKLSLVLLIAARPQWVLSGLHALLLHSLNATYRV